MIIGVAKEIKNNEFRVGLTPSAAGEYVRAGHTVLIEKDAGLGSSFPDAEYEAFGCKIVAAPEEVWAADMVIKVKEPLESEYKYFREGLILYTYLHLAADEELTKALMASGVKAIAYETIMDKRGGLPCLAPMSEIAGRMSIQEGAKYLERPFGGRGVLLGGVTGVKRGNVLILGAGTVGLNAAKIAMGLNANVTITDINIDRLAYIDDLYGSKITTLYSSDANIREALRDADLVIGSVLLPGKATPKLIREEHLKLMKPGAVIVDVAIDQGGCCATSHPTTHTDPIFIKEGIVHYCVANIPGAVSNTSTQALVNRTLPYGLKLASLGVEAACKADKGLMAGVNCYAGKCTFAGVAEALGLEYVPAESLMA